jgi:glutamine synthetase
MTERHVDPATSLAQRVEQRDLGHVKLGVTDIDGVMRGKYLAADELLAGLGGGLGVCSCLIGWDCDDTLYTNNPDGVTGWHTGFPDMPVIVVPETARDLPREFGGKGLLVLGELGGEAAAICPRTLLRNILEEAARMGFEVIAGFEYEFALFAESSETAHAKAFRDLEPLSHGNFGYSILRSANFASLCERLMRDCAAMAVPLVGVHTENGPGIWEAAIGATGALDAADRAAVFKTFSKDFMRSQGLLATFMAKFAPEHQGLGGHIHISLRAKDGAGVFYDEASGSSRILDQFVAGQLALLPEFTALVAPTVNSYARLVPGTWAPTVATWGEDNRTCALRLVGRSASSRRVEFRVAGADANPYLALAAALAAGLDGIRNALPATPGCAGNAYENPGEAARLPASLSEAARLFRGSAAARHWFGDRFVEHYALSREWEEARFRSAVTDWELRRYFEII